MMQSDDMDVEELAMALIDTERCGISPCEFKVLVLPDESDVIASFRRAGLATPDEVNERYRAASMTGRGVSMSPAGFSYHDWPDHVRLLEVGGRGGFGRYAGINIKGQQCTKPEA